MSTALVTRRLSCCRAAGDFSALTRAVTLGCSNGTGQGWTTKSVRSMNDFIERWVLWPGAVPAH